MARILMGDGFDFPGETLPTDLSEAVKFKFRPPTPLSLAKFEALSIANAEAYADGYAEFLAENMGEWNVIGPDEKPIPITKDTFLKCRDWNLLRQFREAILKSDTKAKDNQKKS